MQSHAELLGIDLEDLELERPEHPIQMRIRLRGYNDDTRYLVQREKLARSISGHAGADDVPPWQPRL